MTTLERAHRKLEAIVRALFPGKEWSPVFKPLTDLRLGDFTTDICFRIAAHIRQKPEEIAPRILRCWPGDCPLRVAQDRGFLNFRMPDSPQWLLQQERGSAPPDGTFVLYAIPPRGRWPFLSVFRLWSLALVQGIFLRRSLTGGGSDFALWRMRRAADERDIAERGFFLAARLC